MSSWLPSATSTSTSPELVVTLRLEQPGRAYIVARSFEDERRLRLWLARSDVLERLRDLVAELLEEEQGA